MALLEKIVRTFTLRTAQIGQVALAAVMFLIVANVLMRIPWKPVPGTVELTEILGAVLLTMGVAYCQIVKGHIFVSVLVERFSPRVQGIIDAFTAIIALFFSSALAWETVVFAGRMMKRGYATAHLLIPIYPFIYLVGFGFVMLAIVLLRDFLKAVILAVKGSETP